MLLMNMEDPKHDVCLNRRTRGPSNSHTPLLTDIEQRSGSTDDVVPMNSHNGGQVTAAGAANVNQMRTVTLYIPHIDGH